MESPNLYKDVQQALKTWHGDSNDESPIAYLYLFRHALREGNGSNRRATNQVLLQALEKLGETHEEDASLLQARYTELASIQRIANQFNVAESTVYTIQRRAVRRLVDTINTLEDAASSELKWQLERRLEPSTYDQLIGVEEHVTELMPHLTKSEPPWLISIEGMGGIGKTSLADYLMRQIIQQGRYDEIGWISARQTRFNLGGSITEVTKAALSEEALIEGLVKQLLPEIGMSSELSMDRLMSILRTRLKEIPHLIVIDNLETLIDVESLLPALHDLANPTQFVLTSRESLYGIPNIYHFPVPEPNESNALALIRKEAELRNLPILTHAKDQELLPIYETVGGNPLAIRLVVGQTHIYPLESILADLKSSDNQVVDTFYTYIYQNSWQSLDAKSQQALLAMPLAHPQGDEIEYLAEVGAMSVGDMRMALNQLVGLNLVDARGGLNDRRYSIHSLTRTFLQDHVIKWQPVAL